MNTLICPPNNWKDPVKDIDRMAGIDLVKAIAKRLGLVCRYIPEQKKLYLGMPNEEGKEVVKPVDRPATIEPIPPKKGMLSEHFSEAEFRDGHGKLDQLANLRRLAAKLEVLRKRVGKPIRVTSGYRSPAYNALVGGVPNSFHIQGMAADIFVDGLSVDQLARAAEEVGFGGIGRYYNQDFVHVDIGPVARWTD